MFTKLYELPTTMTARQREAVDIVMRVAQEFEPRTVDGGGRDFYTPQEWIMRGEDYGLRSALIVVHDGGNLAPFFNPNYGSGKLLSAMNKALEASGFFFESCTSWYSAIYCEKGAR
jgi:hypothetical protein